MIRVYPFFPVKSASCSFLICDILFVELLIIHACMNKISVKSVYIMIRVYPFFPVKSASWSFFDMRHPICRITYYLCLHE